MNQIHRHDVSRETLGLDVLSQTAMPLTPPQSGPTPQHSHRDLCYRNGFLCP